jgi:hypothetical protein
LHPALTLLDDMRQFVTKQALPVSRIWLISSRRKINIVPICESQCPDPFCLRAYMNANGGEISAQRSFHFCTHCVRQRQSSTRFEPDLQWIYMELRCDRLRESRRSLYDPTTHMQSSTGWMGTVKLTLQLSPSKRPSLKASRALAIILDLRSRHQMSIPVTLSMVATMP